MRWLRRWLRRLRGHCGVTVKKAGKTVTCIMPKRHEGYHCGRLLRGVYYWTDDDVTAS